MYHLTDITLDAHRAEMQYRTAKLAESRRIRMAQRHWWQRTAVLAPHSTTN